MAEKDLSNFFFSFTDNDGFVLSEGRPLFLCKKIFVSGGKPVKVIMKYL
jgi:hypothetical protein